MNRSAGLSTYEPKSPVRVLIFNDHPVFRSGLVWKLEPWLGIEVMSDTSTLHETLDMSAGAPSVGISAVIADLRISDGRSEGIECTRRLSQAFESAPVIVCTDFYSRSFIDRVIVAGAAAVIRKSAEIDRLVESIAAAVTGPSRDSASIPGAGRSEAA